MESPGGDLETPVLLIAMPQVMDPFFRRSVVLLIHLSEEGAFGLIVNRRTELTVREILDGLEIAWGGDDEAQAGFGGPVQPQMGTVLFRPEDEPQTARPEVGAARGNGGDELDEAGASVEVAPGVRLTQHVGDLAQLAARPPAHFRLFLGYAGWGEGQLMEEILRNDWLTAPVSDELIFAVDADRVWDEALRSVGVDPGTLPAWTGGGDEGDSN
jgi:putative transcriptional regulator